MKKVRGDFRKTVSALLSAAVVWISPGLGAYEAFAAVGIAPVRVAAPIGGTGAAGAGAAGSVGAGASLPLGILRQGPAVSLQGTLTPASGAEFSPSGTPSSLALPESALIPSVEVSFGAIPVFRPGGGGASAAGRSLPATGRRSIEDGRVLELPGAENEISGRSGASRFESGRVRRMFAELRRAFSSKEEAAFEPVGGKVGHLNGRVPAVRSEAVESVSMHGGRSPEGLRPYAAPLESGLSRAPVPLSLRERSGPSDLGVHVEPVSRGTSFRQVTGEDGGLYRPEDFGTEAVKVAAERVAAGKSEKEGSGAWFGLGKVAMMLIASLVVAQIGVESLGAAMPSLIQKTFGDFTAVAQLAIVASIASIAGRQVGPLVVRRVGLKKTYLGAEGVRLLSVSLMAGLLATGHMSLLVMGAFYAVNGILAGISMTALESIPPAIVGQDPARLEKFWTWEQTILETVAIVTPILTGSVVASMGFLPALIAFPVAMAASLAIVLFTLRIPKRLAQLRDAERNFDAAPKRNFFAKLAYGAKLVWKNPALRYSFLAYTFYVLINPFLYTMLAPAFGLRLMPTPELAASVQGWLTGLYSMGGLLGGLLMMLEQWRGKKRLAAMRAEAEARRGKIKDEDWEKEVAPWRRERLRKSMLTWLLLGAAGLSMLVPLAFPMATLGQAVALPAFLSWAGGLTVQAGALVLFGIAQVISVLKLRSFFQSRVPQTDEEGKPRDNMPDAMGFFGSASLLVSTVGLLGLKALFQNVAGFAPFVYIAWGMIPLGALYLFLRWRLSANSR